MRDLPNILTWLRIALIPIFIVLFYLPAPWARPAAAVIFGLAGITDWLDGYLARRLNVATSFGAFLDPVADKLLVVAALVLLVSDARGWLGTLVTLASIVIIGREITISALREWMAELGARGQVAVSRVGKYKTTAQIIA
ncbi:MAG: CDP-diacylglycerol--glycerol-3-phosphate 3-phosphatidyltransferase, partial [Pseudomonadota bacterium]